jgi:hypothetical protein
VLEETPETASVVALEGGITRGLANVRVFVRVMLKCVFVAFRSVQNDPAFDVAVDAGSVTALNPEFVR